MGEQACSIKISYVDAEGNWQIRSTVANASGLATNDMLYLEPTAHGRCRVMLPESSSEMSYEEQSGDLFATFLQRCKLTGALQKMEAWSLQTTVSVNEPPRSLAQSCRTTAEA